MFLNLVGNSRADTWRKLITNLITVLVECGFGASEGKHVWARVIQGAPGNKSAVPTGSAMSTIIATLAKYRGHQLIRRGRQNFGGRAPSVAEITAGPLLNCDTMVRLQMSTLFSPLHIKIGSFKLLLIRYTCSCGQL